MTWWEYMLLLGALLLVFCLIVWRGERHDR